MAPESRAEYFREYRKKKRKQIVVYADPEKVQKLDEKLAQTKESRTAWINRKIDEEISDNSVCK